MFGFTRGHSQTSAAAQAATIVRLPRPQLLCTVRSAINERARVLGATDERRRHALAVAFGELDRGASSGWAIHQGCRDVAGKPLSERYAHGGAA
ncbi:hypothetical protein [Lysobacter olei]